MIRENRNYLMDELSQIDDIKKQWPKYELLSLLGFPKAVRNNLCRWYWGEQDTVSLAEVFELVISSEKDPRPGYLISKILEVRCIGKETFLKVVNSLAEIDFGEKTNLVWKQKYTQFLNAHRVKGSRKHSWSVPITDEGKLLAKFRSGGQYMPRRRKETANKTLERDQVY